MCFREAEFQKPVSAYQTTAKAAAGHKQQHAFADFCPAPLQQRDIANPAYGALTDQIKAYHRSILVGDLHKSWIRGINTLIKLAKHPWLHYTALRTVPTVFTWIFVARPALQAHQGKRAQIVDLT